VLISPSAFATHWAGNSAAETSPEHEIADYADTAGAYRRHFRANAGREAGDPQRAAVAVVGVAHDDTPPLRSPLRRGVTTVPLQAAPMLMDQYPAKNLLEVAA
jgi:hypothetical protein